jgi:hypothetical protein
MDYSIPWHLLPEDDADFFDRAGIERHASSIKFNRELTREELASVCSRLWNFRSIVTDPKENHINFAIGDALNEFSNRFGDQDGAHFMKEFVRLGNLRDHMLKIAGAALIYLQMVEHLIKGCCAILKLTGLNLTIEDFNSTDITRRRHTLGQLKRALVGTFAFSDEFEDQFNRFVSDRNDFVHTFWIGEIKIDDRVGLPSESDFREKLDFMISLMRRAQTIELVFRGLLGSIVASFPENLKSNEVVFHWKKYIPDFNASLRARTR